LRNIFLNMNLENLAEGSEEFSGNVWKISVNSRKFDGSEKPEASSSEVVMVDTGAGKDCWEEISKLNRIDKLVVTHSHYDHIGHLEKVVKKYGSTVYAFEPENLGVEAEKVEEGDVVELCGENFQVFHTPGHRDDSICLYSSEEKILFTGDLIFPDGSFGRTDLDEGDRDLLIDSIEKVADLEVEKFYPGHDGAVIQDAKSSIQRSLENARKRESKY